MTTPDAKFDDDFSWMEHALAGPTADAGPTPYHGKRKTPSTVFDSTPTKKTRSPHVEDVTPTSNSPSTPTASRKRKSYDDRPDHDASPETEPSPIITPSNSPQPVAADRPLAADAYVPPPAAELFQIFHDDLRATHQDTRRQLREDRRQRRLRTKFHTSVCDDEIESEQKENLGEKFMRMAKQLLDKFKQTRTVDQKKLHDAILQTCAPHIYGPDFVMARNRLLRLFKRKESPMAALIMTPRRWGKTEAVAMAVAVLMYVCRGVNIVVFSTTQNIASKLMMRVKACFTELCEATGINPKDKIVHDNVREFYTRHADDDGSMSDTDCLRASRYNSIEARSQTAKNSRGIAADIFILEEAAYIHPMILQQVIAPMLIKMNTVFIGLSTNNGSENYFSKLFRANTVLHNELFVHVEVDKMCAACKAERRKPWECKHNDHKNPPWLIAAHVKRAKLFMTSDAMVGREIYGTIMDDEGGIFEQDWLDRLMKKPRVSLNFDNSLTIFTFVDPSGGGGRNIKKPRSECAIVSVVRLANNEVVIVGLDKMNTRSAPDIAQLVRGYMQSFKRHSILGRMRHVVLIENNYGGSGFASMFVMNARAVLPTLIEYRSDPTASGVRTNEFNKSAGAHYASWDLNDNNVSMHDVVCTSQPKNLNDLVKELHEQNARLQWSEERGRRSVCGSGKKNGIPDDLSIAYIMVSYWSYACQQQDLYQNRLRLESQAGDASSLPNFLSTAGLGMEDDDISSIVGAMPPPQGLADFLF